MKKLPLIFVAAAVILIVLYLGFSMMNLTLDFSIWPSNDRTGFAALFITDMLSAVLISAIEYPKK